MKIKKVQIDSFRLFDDEIVPFVNSQHQEGCANLVAIHAPNGFGKTSLFDAIEFCVTNNIQRLKTVTFKDDIKSDQTENEYSSFIHNKDNPQKEIGIKIEYEDGTTQERYVAPNDEMKLLKGNPENEYFNEVILSQDWFSRFLSATDATQRFEMFTKNFRDTDGLLEYYEQLKTAHNIIRKRISSISSDLSQEKKKLKDNVDEQIVEHLEDAIKKLAEVEVLIEWNRTINDKQIENLLLQGEQKIFDANEERKSAQTVIGNIEKLKSGQDELISITNLEPTLSKIEVLLKNIKCIDESLKKIQVLKSLIATIEKLNVEMAKCEGANNDLDYLIYNYPVYKEIADKINEINKQREAKINERVLLNGMILQKQKELNVSQEQHEQLTKERDGWKNKKDGLKEEYAKYQNLLAQINQSNTDEQTENQKLSQITPKIEEKNKESQRLTQLLIILRQGQVNVEIDDYKEESQKIISLDKSIKEKTTLADNLGRTIQEQHRYMGQVEALVVNAREMAVTLKSGVCPLCGQNYGQVEKLLFAIENNHSISKSIEDTIKMKEAAEQEIVKLKNDRNKLYVQLEEKVTERINAVKAVIENLLAEKKGIDETLAGIRHKRQTAQEKVKSDYSAFENQTETQLLAMYEERLRQAENLLADATKQKETVVSDLGKMQNILNDLTQLIEGLSKELLENQKQSEYAEYKNKLNERKEENPTLESWKQKQTENKKTIAEYKEKISSAHNEKVRMESEGVSLAEEVHLTEQENIIAEEKKALDAQYLRTIQFIRDDCKAKGVDSETSLVIIKQEIEKSKKFYSEKADICENRGKLLAAYMNLLKSAEQYNGQQKIKKKIDDLVKQAERYDKRQKDIDAETENLKNYLDEFVQSYFQLDLINFLYNTIDPHPSYKKVEFKCDFNQKKPRLLVIMVSVKDDGDKIVPNLYLSTAQINILSFCIFMAKAMFAKTDKGKALDCIFVDDPIQALDDINILSMIDLLRNVAFTLNKQIVITTHDLNFFKLLQKKMPQDKFNSCYLQLRERGKFSVAEN